MNKINNYNTYDYAVQFLLASLAAGGMGNSFQIVRVLTILFIPLLIRNFKSTTIKFNKRICAFFLFWMGYCLLSLFWTPSISQAAKDIIYNLVHMLLFLEIITFTLKSNNPIETILKGWKYAFIITLPVALYEISTDIHLYSSVLEGDVYRQIDGYSLKKKFAAVTFGNYNAYNTFLCFVAPFIFTSVAYAKSKNKQLYSYFLLLFLFYICLINASRGTVFSLAIMLVIFISFHKQYRLKRNKGFALLILVFVGFVILQYGNSIFEQFIFRIAKNDLFEDNVRSYLIKVSWQAYSNSFYLGNGIGSLISSLQSVDRRIIIPPHNLLLEVLVQFGAVITFILIYYIFKLASNGFSSRYDNTLRLLFRISTLPLMFVFVINSGYLMMPSLWAYFASLEVLKKFRKKEC